ncbi:hypothetical protein VSDG_09979 [Cytospora chrysosperma]|uniref:Uncharacterized protein n=1 Tax=Cytospora chrysosperma TaxID=252740 RepID=A0A423V8K8_CYTCH|nr:hypothetical protein VSDG_09979 [Valsa sordida]
MTSNGTWAVHVLFIAEALKVARDVALDGSVPTVLDRRLTGQVLAGGVPPAPVESVGPEQVNDGGLDGREQALTTPSVGSRTEQMAPGVTVYVMSDRSQLASQSTLQGGMTQILSKKRYQQSVSHHS